MSLIRAKAIQMGYDATASNNFLIYQPLTPDGTFRIANGNQGATTDIMTVSSAGNVTFAGSTNFATLNFGSGSQTAPSLAPIGNTNTGVFFPATNTVGITTAGVERLRIDSNGIVGLNNTSPSTTGAANMSTPLLHGYRSGSTAIQLLTTENNGNALYAGQVHSTSLNATIFRGYRLRGSMSSPVAAVSGDPVTLLQASAYDGTQYRNISSIDQYVDTVVGTDDISGSIRFNTKPNGAGAALTERMRIASSGYVGIGGGFSPAAYLHIKGDFENNYSLKLQGTYGNGRTYGFRTHGTDSDTLALYDVTGGYRRQLWSGDGSFTWEMSGSQRMVLDSSGVLCVGAIGNTFGIAGGGFSASTGGHTMYLQTTATGGYSCLNMMRTASAGNITQHYYLNTTSGYVGGIAISSGTTVYGTSSDYRLKENIKPLQNALEKVALLNPVTYTWKRDGSDGQGFIAHELQEIIPDAVVGEKDGVEIIELKDEDGNVTGTEERPAYQSVDTSFLVATLTKAIQELAEQNKELKARLDAAGL